MRLWGFFSKSEAATRRFPGKPRQRRNRAKRLLGKPLIGQSRHPACLFTCLPCYYVAGERLSRRELEPAMAKGGFSSYAWGGRQFAPGEARATTASRMKDFTV